MTHSNIPLRLVVVILLTPVLMGCAGLRYYAQSIAGHMEVAFGSRPIVEVLGESDVPAEVADKLRLVLKIRRFASTELALPDNDSYLNYVDLKRPYVVWNVFAAPELSLEPRQWCFPMVGCVVYRGYYREERARQFAAVLQDQGDDIFVGGVPAYSTLGWFDDPLPSTVVHYSEAYLAGLIFHELAHQLVYVRDDAVFNESFATVVEMEGARRWFESRHGRDQLQAYRTMKDRGWKNLQLGYYFH